MEIGKKLQEARLKAGLTQEDVAEKIFVSRQTISNWENEKSYPDITSIIQLSDLYSMSLDELLKGDQQMMKYLEESTDTVKSNKKLMQAIGLNILLVVILIASSALLPENQIFLIGIFCIMIISTSILLYEIIKKI